MNQPWKPLLALCLLSLPSLAGGLLLEIVSPASSREALAREAVVVTRVTACHSPQSASVKATAEGLVNGARESIPLEVFPLSTAATYGIKGTWPQTGSWVIKVTATMPAWKNYATGVIIPVEHDIARVASAKHFFHAPLEAEVTEALN